MALQPPPQSVGRQVAQVLGPSFWSAFVTAAERGWSSMPDAIPTSWFRSQSRNRSVGGAPRSQHLWGLALDFWVPGAADHRSDERAGQLADALSREGFITVRESDHVHVQVFPAGSI